MTYPLQYNQVACKPEQWIKDQKACFGVICSHFNIFHFFKAKKREFMATLLLVLFVHA